MKKKVLTVSSIIVLTVLAVSGNYLKDVWSTCYYIDCFTVYQYTTTTPCDEGIPGGYIGAIYQELCCSGPSGVGGLINCSDVIYPYATPLYSNSTRKSNYVHCQGTGVSFIQCNYSLLNYLGNAPTLPLTRNATGGVGCTT